MPCHISVMMESSVFTRDGEGDTAPAPPAPVSSRQMLLVPPNGNDYAVFIPVAVHRASKPPCDTAPDELTAEIARPRRRFYRRATPFGPGQDDVFVMSGARHVPGTHGHRKRAVFEGTGGEFVDDQSQRRRRTLANPQPGHRYANTAAGRAYIVIGC